MLLLSVQETEDDEAPHALGQTDRQTAIDLDRARQVEAHKEREREREAGLESVQR